MVSIETEKRHGQRIAIVFPLKIIKNHLESVLGESVNLSRTGLCCLCKESVPVSTAVEILLLLPPFLEQSSSQVIKARGVIVRKEVSKSKTSEWFMAVRFTDVTMSDWDLLETFVQFYSNQQN